MVKINPSEAIYGDNKNVDKKVDDKKKPEGSVMQGYGGEFNPMDGLGIERTEPKTNKAEPETNKTVPVDDGMPPKDVPNAKNSTMPTDTGIPNAEPVEAKSKKGGLTLEQVKEARDDGKVVAEFLGGHTNRLEQEKVKEIILEKVNSENIIEFLRGYMQNKSFTTDRLFEQLESEWGFEEAQNLMKKLAGDLQAYCEKHNHKYSANEIKLILMENGFSKEDAERLDDLSGHEEKRATNAALYGGVVSAVARAIMD